MSYAHSMLLVLMYHQIYNPANPASLKVFAQHLAYLQHNYPIVLPGQPLLKNSLNICLTFDDAYFDFYHYVFPLLQQFKIPAVLGIPTGLIQDATTVNTKTRLAVPYPTGLAIDKQQNSPLCTWLEIKEMQASNYVHAAAHTHNHVNLTHANLDVTSELQHAKVILEQKLNCAIDSLVFPFGKTNNAINSLARQYYKYIFRIGSALNLDWHSRDGLLYRINADAIWQKNLYLTNRFLLKLWLKYWLNYCRNK